MLLNLSALVAAGFLTFLSPCVLPLVPIYLAMLAGTSAASLREGAVVRPRLLLAAVAFSAGLASVFVALGMAASTLGRTLSGHRTLLLQLAGLAVFLAGLKLMGFLHVPGLDRERRPWLASVRRGGSLAWPFLFGAAFAFGWSPCVGPTLASALAMAATSGSALRGAYDLAAYALGLTLPLIAVAALAPLALRLLDRAKRHFRVFELSSGALLAGVGLLFITGHASALMPDLSPSPVQAHTTEALLPQPATCGAGLPAPGGEPPRAVAQQSADEAATDDTPTMVEFVSAGCPICRRMAPLVAKAERDCSAHGVRIRQIDIATPGGREGASRYGILGVPTFIFVDKQGTEVARLVGEQPEPTLVQTLEVLAGQRCDGFHRLGAAPSPGS